MRLVYAHFPIQCFISKDKTQIEIRNFLGGKQPKTVNLNPGCTVFQEDKEVLKDSLIFDGIDNAALSQSCARVSQVCKLGGKKDERKFLDGIFVA